MTQPAVLPRVTDAQLAVRAALREQYLSWLETPAHEALQITGQLFAKDGPSAGCCAIGGLMVVLEEAGYARIENGRAVLHLETTDEGPQDMALDAGGLYTPGMVEHYPDELAGPAGLGLGLSLGQIAGLNDGPCSPYAFWEIAEKIRAQPATLQ